MLDLSKNCQFFKKSTERKPQTKNYETSGLRQLQVVMVVDNCYQSNKDNFLRLLAATAWHCTHQCSLHNVCP